MVNISSQGTDCVAVCLHGAPKAQLSTSRVNR